MEGWGAKNIQLTHKENRKEMKKADKVQFQNFYIPEIVEVFYKEKKFFFNMQFLMKRDFV